MTISCYMPYSKKKKNSYQIKRLQTYFQIFAISYFYKKIKTYIRDETYIFIFLF